MTGTTPALSTIATKFIENGAAFLAVEERELAEGSVRLQYHFPSGTSNEQWEKVERYLEAELLSGESKIPKASVLGQEMPLTLRSNLIGGAHSYGRIPIFARGVPGIDDINLEEGVANIRDFINGSTEPSPKRAKTIELRTLLNRLAEAGAASVEWRHQMYKINEDLVELRVPITPAIGAPEIAPFGNVLVDGDRFDLKFTLTLDGPCGIIGIGLYISDSVRGANPVSIDDGVKRFNEVREIIDNEDSPYEASKRLEERGYML